MKVQWGRRGNYHSSDTLRTPHACFSTYARGYLGSSDPAVALVGESLAAVQSGPAVAAALFEVFHRCFVHPLLQQRELGGGEREGREKELVRQERKLMAVFKKNDGGE